MGNGESTNTQDINGLNHLIDSVTFEPDDDLLSSIIDDLFDEMDKQEALEQMVPDFVIPIGFGSAQELYSYQRKIGKGVSGDVFLVQSKLTQKQYALKELQRTHLNYKSFMNEINILKQIDHPNIIHLNDAYISEQQFLLTTEYCAKGSLLDQIKVKKRFSEKKAAEFLKKLLEALEYIHSKNIVHRDLKLSNIVLDRYSQLKLIDFGQSEQITDYDETVRNIFGSLYYLSPEVTEIRTKRALFGADMWSVGIILYILVQGTIPFKGDSIESLIQNIHDSELKYTQSVSDLCKDLIESLLNKDVTKRLTAKEALQHPWIINAGNHNNDGVESVDGICAKSIKCTNELQRIMIDAVLSQMSEMDRNALFCIKYQYLTDEQLINYIISSYSNAHYEERSLSKVNVNTLDIDDIFAEIDSETEHRKESKISSPTDYSIFDGIRLERFIHILKCSPKNHNISQIVSDLLEEGSNVISFKSIASYNIPIQEV